MGRIAPITWNPKWQRPERRAHQSDEDYRKMEYRLYMSSPQWYSKREEAFEKWGRVCACYNCHETQGLQMHHLTYVRFTHERVDDLRPMCKSCHACVSFLWEFRNPTIDKLTLYDFTLVWWGYCQHDVSLYNPRPLDHTCPTCHAGPDHSCRQLADETSYFPHPARLVRR